MASLVAIKRAQTALINPCLRSHAIRPMTILSKESAEEYKKFNYTTRMKDTGRPVSPHVTIYAFPVAAISSILNRVTGCALSVGCAGLGAAELVGGSGTSLYLMQLIGSQGFLVAAAAKYAVTFPIVYHYFGALRHFSWDYQPDRLTNADVEKASKMLIAGSVVVSGAFLFV
uniref:Succinate dehydrogenase cytochrome b560 subunit, mitochondrial n=1 Tax=Entomoneis paludosa TaxID=265537 RepID=A0A6U3BVD0_9STRA|eukprot:CAMPEP_0172442900 /NCGR_PEP_ID=MMETSP1065-20121228/3255_1 /TAXON_ID=265537 /ORGANISM="Amphiprora paludosa, Strain CCMP125" /LENGTH=171 /DNA_ID=CAMNT_0013192945 /DNA_START=12 /DNA_END=527 /DNA_ORIENTATION=-